MILACGYRPDFLLTSTMRRATETAEMVIARLGEPSPQLLRAWRLNEGRYGSLTGPTKADVLQEAGARTYETRRPRTSAMWSLGSPHTGLQQSRRS